MQKNRKIIHIDEDRCDGCGQCIISCAEGALQIVDGKAKLVSDIYCDGLGACLNECPQDALHLIERPAEEFDPEAVEERLREQEGAEEAPAAGASGCPGAQATQLKTACQAANEPREAQAGDSALSHWPVQIRLVPPDAPFLRDADLLVTADCVPVAYPNFHQDFLAGRKVLLGCPKLDEQQSSVRKFEEIFESSNPRSVTILSMEVPCCSSMNTIVEKAMRNAGKEVPIRKVVVKTDGTIQKEEHQAVR
jgi:Pyruvate/2-oxoacid:ferredoxin oxidoreductase delta subunit